MEIALKLYLSTVLFALERHMNGQSDFNIEFPASKFLFFLNKTH